jgi:hypothetical protein
LQHIGNKPPANLKLFDLHLEKLFIYYDIIQPAGKTTHPVLHILRDQQIVFAFSLHGELESSAHVHSGAISRLAHESQLKTDQPFFAAQVSSTLVIY